MSNLRPGLLTLRRRRWMRFGRAHATDWEGRRVPRARRHRPGRGTGSGTSRCLPVSLEHELEANHSTPERGAIRYRVTFTVFDVFPDAVDLQLHEAVQGPVHAQGQRAFA